MQNRMAELQGLVKFLRHDPYAYYVCHGKGKDGSPCKCKKLEWNFGARGARCTDPNCLHTPMQVSRNPKLFRQQS